jgi:hypothetical protein
LPQHAASAWQRPALLSQSLQATATQAPAPALSHGAQRQPLMPLQALLSAALQVGLQPPPQEVSTLQKPQLAEFGSVLHAWPTGQPPPHVVSQTHWPQVGDTVLVSHLAPEEQPPPPQVWSQTQTFRVGLHTKPAGQCPQVGGWHRPQVAELVSELQTSLLGQPPPQVVSQEHVPQVEVCVGFESHF